MKRDTDSESRLPGVINRFLGAPGGKGSKHKCEQELVVQSGLCGTGGLQGLAMPILLPIYVVGGCVKHNTYTTNRSSERRVLPLNCPLVGKGCQIATLTASYQCGQLS
jgi:hypothetical protein